jgi:hypothetical protein
MLLFRLLTLLLSVLSGWLSFTHVTRKGGFIARDPVAALTTAEDGVHAVPLDTPAGGTAVKFGISTFFNRSGNPTHRSGARVEDRNFDSLFVAEHTHIPVDRRSRYPASGELPDIYQV